MNKEIFTLLVNGAIAIAVVVLMGLGRIPLEIGVLVVGALATPSALPTLLDKLRDRRASQQPPRGPSSLGGILLFLAAAAHFATFAACRSADVPRQTLPSYCYDEAALTAALTACVASSSTRAASRACRADVNASCGFVETVTADAGDGR